MENKRAPSLFGFRRPCKVCGKAANQSGLCRTHDFWEGTIWILNMKSWTWKRETRKIAGTEKA
jgi:hypothetical protein